MILGTIILLTGYLLAHSICKFAIHDADISPFGIAVVHSIFNIAATIILQTYLDKKSNLKL